MRHQHVCMGSTSPLLSGAQGGWHIKTRPAHFRAQGGLNSLVLARGTTWLGSRPHRKNHEGMDFPLYRHGTILPLCLLSAEKRQKLHSYTAIRLQGNMFGIRSMPCPEITEDYR